MRVIRARKIDMPKLRRHVHEFGTFDAPPRSVIGKGVDAYLTSVHGVALSAVMALARVFWTWQCRFSFVQNTLGGERLENDACTNHEHPYNVHCANHLCNAEERHVQARILAT